MGLAGVIALKRAGFTDFTWGSIAEATLLHLFYVPYFNSHSEQLFGLLAKNALFPLNNPAWSLFFELACANALYAFVARSRYAPAVIVAIAAVGMVLAMRRYGATPGWGTNNFLGGLPRVAYTFFAGVLVYQLRDRLRILGSIGPILPMLALALLFGLPRTAGFPEFWLVSVLVAIPMLVAAAFLTEVHGAKALKLAEYSGRLSYPIYTVHFPLLMLMAAAAWRPGTFWAALALFVAASIVVAHVLTAYVDEPVRRRLGARLRPAGSPPGAPPSPTALPPETTPRAG
jgi:peptidoglycan/LPS O-acetylase OafA/YrhL